MTGPEEFQRWYRMIESGESIYPDGVCPYCETGRRMIQMMNPKVFKCAGCGKKIERRVMKVL